MAAPGPEFRWGIVLRRSKLNVNGTEESTNRQEYEITSYIRDNNMGVVVQTYKDIAVLSIDRLARRKDQVRPVLDALEAMGGRLLSLEASWTLPTIGQAATQSFGCRSW